MIKNITILHTLMLLLVGAASMLLPSNIYAQTIHGSVYGGGEVATIGGNTSVTIYDGHFGADIFGGGKGALNEDSSVKASADITGNTTVNINGGEFSVRANTNDATKDRMPFLQRHNIYGGGNIACVVGKGAYLNMAKGMLTNSSDDSGNFLKTGNGMDKVYMKEGKMFFSIFGGGFGKNTSVTENTYVDFNVVFGGCQNITGIGLSGDMVENQTLLDVVGGGFNGSVGGNTYVHVGGDAMCRNLYGGGLYATIGGNTFVDVTGGNIDNVYGGGVMGDINGTDGTQVTIGLHESESHQDAAGNTIIYEKHNDKIAILGSVYGGNDVSGHVTKATIVHKGGTIGQNIYGAGNGDYTAYYEPGLCAYDEGENDNYTTINNGSEAPNGTVYKSRPHTDNVSITMGGAAESDKAKVKGQVFVGGNSCTIGQWNSTKLITDPTAFEGGGQAHVTLNNHVAIGYTNADLTAAGDDVKSLYLRDGENVSGLYMGCSGDHLATQTTDHNDRYYHRYYDSTTNQYWPGFPVYNTTGTLLTRSEGQAVFDAYLNNILLWTDDVQLTIANDATDIWLANFVGGGFRGSVKAKTASKQFAWTMPAGVTIGNNVVGGAYNTDVVYRIFETTGGHTYTTDSNGDYQYLTEKGDMKSIEEDADNGAYHHIEYAADGTTITGIARFNYAGGILKSDNNPADITLTLNNKMQGGDVFGGCFASGTVANTTINYYATDANEVYGGGALANIAGNTNVNLFGGSLMNAYGGGLGRKADIPNSITAVEALVKGDATVTLGKADKSTATEVRGSIFGANNVNGTPKGQVLVHVQKTAVQTIEPMTSTYHVPAVYGGGNQAAYVPTLNTVSPQVIVENCDNSIEYVYGGGNAAPVPGTDVKIYGGTIGHVFGGGNGKGDGNPGADVGYNGYYSQTNTATPTYGPGTASLVVYGGTIEDVFGGSNTLGYIRTSASVSIDKLPDDAHCEVCPLIVENVHGGGNEAPMFCNGSITLNCTKGVDVIYGGSNNADIHGNIDLNITSGTYSKVFCGNNTGGNIYGHLNLNIAETGCWPIIIGELYGGGNDAPYSMYGYTNEGPRTKTQFDAMTNEQKTAEGIPYDSPTVRIVSCTKIGTVFGGGKGVNAVIYGDPIVDINLINGHFAGHDVTGFYDVNDEGNRELVEHETRIPDDLGTIGNVYGGGNAAAVYGDTFVKITNGRFSANIFGGGMGVLNDDGSVQASADVKGNTTVEIFGGEFSVVKNEGDDKEAKPFVERYNIYGGGNVACKVGTMWDNDSNPGTPDVLKANTGDTHLKIAKGMFSNNSDGTGNFLESGAGAMDLAYEREGKMYFCAFGGGYGKNTSVLGNSYVDFNIAGGTNIETVGLEDDMLPWQSLLDVVGGGFNGDVKGNTFVHVGGNAMCRNLYGGGLYASIGGTTTVDVTGGNIDNVYGGGVMGDILGTTGVDDDAYSTLVNIGLHADREIYDGYSYIKNNQKITILGSVYGGNDVSGHVGTATIHHMGGTINQNIYGAGNGNYRGYYTPNTCDFNDGENDNYFDVVHADGKPENSGRTYRGRPQTDNVRIIFDGLSSEDRAVVLGQVFGGGNSCTIGEWDADLLASDKYKGNPHEVRDDPAYFLGGGELNIHFKNHVTIGRSRTQIDGLDEDTKSECLNDDGVNVTGLYMGCCGKDLVTQTLNPTDYTYHHYYDAFTEKYWQGFAVYADDGTTPLTRTEGMKAYDAYLNNILVRSDDVRLSFDNTSEDIWLANFVGGGFRGSMQALTEDGKFDYTLPAGVTVADAIIGGSFNAHVQYRIYDTEDGHTYKKDGDGNYLYLTDKTGLKGPDDVTAPEEPDYLRELFDDDGNTIGLVRFNYEGGILAENALDSNEHHTGAQVTTRRNVIAPAGEFSAEKAEELKNNINTVSAKALLRINLFNKVEPSLNGDVVSGGNVYGGCFQSGVVNGDSWVNYICGLSPAVASQPGFNITNQESVNKMIERADDYNKNFGLMLFGAGYGRDTEMKGDCFTAVGTGAKLYNAFGGSYKGKCDSRTFMFCDSQSSGIVAGRLYGGSSMGDIGGSSYAYVNSGNISYVYGGNDVCGKIKGHTYVLVHGGTVFGDVYGAGNGNYLYQVDPQVKEIVATWNNELNKYIYRVPVPADMVSFLPLTTAQKLTIINNTRPSVTQANIELNGKAAVAASGTEGQPGYVPAKPAEYLYINGSAYVGGNSSTVTDGYDPVRLKIGKYVVLNNLFLGSNGENLKVFEYVSNLEKLNDMKLDTNDLLQQYMDGAVAVGNLSPTWATEFSKASNYHETYIGNLCLGGNAGSVLANQKLALTIPETITMFGNFIAGSKDAVFKYRDAEHRGGMTQPMAEGHYNEPKLELHIRNKWQAKKLDFMPENAATHYLVDNLDGDAYAEGCNVYGGCYQSGTMIGSIEMYIESDMLEYDNDLATFESSERATKLKNSNARNITVANIYGAGYGPESRNYGNVDIILKDNPENNSHPSINNIYGGGRNGVLCGHANVRINDGLVYGDVVGGCFAANLYGSTNITVGYPKYYVCEKSGKYTLQRGDTWNTALLDKDGNKVLKDEIRYLRGDRVPQNIYDQIVGFCAIGSEGGAATDIASTLQSAKGTTSAYFTYVDEATLTGAQSLFPSGGWNDVDINILGGVYGGGYSLNNSTAATAGSNTVRKMTAHSPGKNDGFNHDRDQSLGLTDGQTTEGYGGNSSIIIADNTGLAANHIKISQSGVGGIFGDGHLVFCEGFRAADITGYGYGASTVGSPLLLNTFQRFDLLDVNDCCLKLEGAQDFAADQTDATVYSLARVNELRMNSSIDASEALAATSNAKARNYVELGKNVHLLGSLITNDAFGADYHSKTGAHESGSYQAKKQTYITNYTNAADKSAALNEFKQRNLGTARNMIGINSGNALRIQNQHYEGSTAKNYYGPVIGVCEVNLLTLQDGEGGGYVYAKNIHSRDAARQIDDNIGNNMIADAKRRTSSPGQADFLQTSGNFVFPSKNATSGIHYIVDDCFPKHFGTDADKVTPGNGAAAEAHYWYVEGDKYFFNTTLTGYTYKKAAALDKQTFNLKTNDENVLLSGVESGKKLRIKSVTWNTNPYPAGYQTDLKDISSTGYTPTAVSGSTPYAFSIKVGDVWSATMNRSNMDEQTASNYTNGTDVLPIFDVELQDYVNNDGEAYYNKHLALPEKVTIVMEALDGIDQHVATYTVNMDVVYVLGPTYDGNVLIKNCALPGERIAFGSDGITVKTSDQMPITGTGWKLCPKGSTPGTWDASSADAIDIPKSQYDSDLSGGATTGWVHAQRKYDGWNVAYTFTAGGHTFTVWPSQDATKEQEKHLVVHNYYDMEDVVNEGALYHINPQMGARIYIRNKEGWDAFVNYLNAATADNTLGIPAGLAGMKLYLQTDITLDAVPSISVPFAGELNGDGYSITIPSGSLFGSSLAAGAKVYNLGVIGGNSVTTVENATANCFVKAASADFVYGTKAYELSHNYTTTAQYITGNRYVKGALITAAHDDQPDVYAAGDWQYARQNSQDSRMLRTGVTPNYGSTVTAHNMEHTAAEITEHDCLFFGQTLTPDGIASTPYPQHIDESRSDGEWVEANRVYEAEGYYRSKTDKKFHYNKAAWALQPTLTAVHFTGDAPVTFGNTEGITKNLLVYGADDVEKADKSTNYHHVKGTLGSFVCADLALVDKEDFNAPLAFTATKASYVRKPGEETGYVDAPATAWESICLPFSPTKATLSEGILIYPYDAEGEWTKNGERTLKKDITFFYGTSEDYESGNHIRHEYWLRELQSASIINGKQTAAFVRPGFGIDDAVHRGFKAYTPYIVSFPGKRFYEFDMTGQTVTFSAADAAVGVTDDAATATLSKTNDGVTYTGAFLNESATSGKYAIELKADNDKASGDKFEDGKAVYPFRAYMTGSVSAAKIMSRAIYIGGTLENTPENFDDESHGDPGNGEVVPAQTMKAYAIRHSIVIESNYEDDVLIYTSSGQLARAVRVLEGDNLYTGFASGVYVINGKKLIVR